MKTNTWPYVALALLLVVMTYMLWTTYSGVIRVDTKADRIITAIDSLPISGDTPRSGALMLNDTSMSDTTIVGDCIIASGESTDIDMPSTGVDMGVVFLYVVNSTAVGTPIKHLIAMVAHPAGEKYTLSVVASGEGYRVNATKSLAAGAPAGVSIGVRSGLSMRPYVTAAGYAGPGSVVHIEDADDEDPGLPHDGTPVLYARQASPGVMTISGFMACEPSQKHEFGPAVAAGTLTNIPVRAKTPTTTSAKYQWVSTTVSDPDPTATGSKYRVHFSSVATSPRTFTARD